MSSYRGCRKYKLVGRRPVPCDSLLEWATWFETASTTVARTEIGDRVVATVFLGLDHRFFGQGPPILFETAVFHRSNFGEIEGRYATWEKAEEGHKAVVAQVERTAELAHSLVNEKEPVQ